MASSADVEMGAAATPTQPLSPRGAAAQKEDEWVKLPQEWQEVYSGQRFQPASLLPPLTWLPRYLRAAGGRASEADLAEMGSLPYSLKGDAVAGLTVGVMLVPQCMAFALLAGLPVQVGLYASVAPLLIYALFGTIRQLQVGPTALMSLLTGQALDAAGLVSAQDRIAGAALLALLVGLANILLGLVRFGIIVDFMSHSVMTAFCTASGVVIATSQLKDMLGLKIPRSHYWWETVENLARELPHADAATAALGFSLLALLVTLKAWKTAGSAQQRAAHRLWRFLPREKTSAPFRALKLFADFSSVISVVLGWLWAAAYREAGVSSVRVIGSVNSDGFSLALPHVDAEQISDLLVSAVMMTLVGFLETVAIGGKYAAQHRYSYDANQELLALGLANLGSAAMAGFPITGGFSRTAVNAMFGATSQWAGAITSSMVVLAVYLLLPVVAYLPLAALAPLIIQGALSVTDLPAFAVTYRANRGEFALMVATALMSLALSVKEGLILGFALSVCKTLYDVAMPNLVVCGQVSDKTFRDIRRYPDGEMLPGCVVVRMDAQLNYSNSRRLQEFCVRALQVRERLEAGTPVKFLVIDCKAMNGVDMTGCEMLESLGQVLEKRGTSLVLANLKGPVTRSLCAAGVDVHLQQHKGHLCWDMEQAIKIVEGGDANEAREKILDLDRRVKAGAAYALPPAHRAEEGDLAAPAH